MKRWQIILAAALTIVLAATLPGAWDKDKPADGRAYDLRDNDVRTNNSALQTALNKEHEFSGTTDAAQEMFHRAGSAAAFYQAAAPTTRVDGTAFDANDSGRLWIDSDDYSIWVRDQANTRWSAAGQIGPLSVKSYGATGDGSTDDAASIQAALTAAASATKAVFVPAGTYIIGTTLTVPANTCLYGVGSASVLKCKNSTSINVLTLTDCDNVIIRDLRLDGNRANNTYQSDTTIQHCAYLVTSTEAVSGVRFFNVEFVNPEGSGFRSVTATDMVIRDLWFINCRVDTALRGLNVIGEVNDVRIEGCTIRSTDEVGISLAVHGVDYQIIGNRVYDPDGGASGAGIYVVGGASDTTYAKRIQIIGNILTDDGDADHGITVSSDCRDVLIQGNTTTGFLYSGITCDFYATGTVREDANCVVIGNFSYDNATDHGINVRGGDHALIVGNHCRGNASSGIFASSVTQLAIAANYCYDNTGTQLYVTGVNDVVISGNLLYGPDSASYDGIAVYDANRVDILANKATHNRYGVLIYSDCNEVTITGNSLEGNTTGEVSDLASAASAVTYERPMRVVAKTANYSLSGADDWGKHFTNTGATGTITFTLPAAAVGKYYRFTRLATFALHIDVQTGENIRGGGAGKYMSLDADGTTVTLRCLTTGVWEIEAEIGTTSFEA